MIDARNLLKNVLYCRELVKSLNSMVMPLQVEVSFGPLVQCALELLLG